MSTIRFTTQEQVRRSFWETFFPCGCPPQFRGIEQNQLPADIRMDWVSHVDQLARTEQITDTLANRVTLKGIA